MTMKICVIGPTYPYRGGISHYNTLLCETLKKKHNVKSISFKRLYPSFLYPGENQKDLESKERIKVSSEFSLDSINPVTWLKVFSKIRKEKPDLLILHWWTPFFTPLCFTLSFLIKHLAETKILFVCHNILQHEARFIDRILTKIALKRSDFFVVHSNEDHENLKAILPGAEVKQTVHPTYEVFKFTKISESEAKKGLELKNKVVLHFGFVREYKGLKILIEAMPKVLEKLNVNLLIAGEFWDDKKKYMDIINELRIEREVSIIDKYIPNEDVGLYFSAADLVVLPYISATQSGIIQIAFGFDKPVITTNVGGLPDVVKDGETGFIVPAEDSNALSDAIIRYFEEDREREFEANIKKQKDIFSWDRMVEIIESFCKNI